MIEYELSMLVRCSRGSVNHVLQNLQGGITATANRKEPHTIFLETRSPYVGSQIDFAVNHFLDLIAPIQLIEGVATADLKVCAFFDPEKIAALNFELGPSTVVRLAGLGRGFDLWAMPGG